MKNHKHEIGDIVNNTLIIVRKTRHGKENRLAYEVQSVTYPDAPTYIIMEKKLNIGQGCAYTSGKRVFEGNSLYNIKWARPYITDFEQAKTITPYSSKKIVFKCECGKEKVMCPSKFMEYGSTCPSCSKGTSYPELLVIAYLEVKGIEYEYQKTFKDLSNRRFDFFIQGVGILETHGGQHFNDTLNWNHKETKESDLIKRNFCKDNNMKLIELDCSRSYFRYIVESINECGDLPNISKEEEDKILEVMAENKRHPVNEIVQKYKSGLSTLDLASEYNVSDFTIANILKNQKINLRGGGKKVKCITTGKTFNTAKEASEYYNVSRGHISNVCKGKRKTTGKDPLTGEKLQWEYIDYNEYKY